jgi:hypothetical protein
VRIASEWFEFGEDGKVGRSSAQYADEQCKSFASHKECRF